MDRPAPPSDTAPTARSCLLTINGGSSSLKFALFEATTPPRRFASGRVERIGQGGARLVVGSDDRAVEAPDHAAAIGLVLEEVERTIGRAALAAVGHRIVFGGSRFSDPERITPEILEALRRLATFDPDHLPGELAPIEAVAQLDPDLPQVACFDSAFHRDLPRVAQIVPIPRRFEADGVRRYGYHGLSYTYLMEELARLDGAGAARGRVVLAHLGSGASLAAVYEGRSRDTTMGFTPTSGLVMGTRSGDLDPGLVLFLARTEGISAERFHEIVNRESGLLGVSETSADLRDLQARAATDPRAAEAIALFGYRAKLGIGAFAAALGGLDTLIFSGGIGEHAPAIRTLICQHLDFLGIALDAARNAANAPVISADGARVKVRVIPTDEELVIARSALAFLPGE